jgi:adenylylsulfate kinase
VSLTETGAVQEGLLITGTVGVGKSTVAAHVGDILTARRVPHAVIDLDWLRTSWPTPPEDPFNLAMELQNLNSVAANYRHAGVDRFVLAGVLERRGDLPCYEHAIGEPVRVVRLRAEPRLVRQRLLARHALDPARRRWHLARADELDAILDDARVSDIDIDIGTRAPESIAMEVTSCLGW